MPIPKETKEPTPITALPVIEPVKVSSLNDEIKPIDPILEPVSEEEVKNDDYMEEDAIMDDEDEEEPQLPNRIVVRQQQTLPKRKRDDPGFFEKGKDYLNTAYEYLPAKDSYMSKAGYVILAVFAKAVLSSMVPQIVTNNRLMNPEPNLQQQVIIPQYPYQNEKITSQVDRKYRQSDFNCFTK